MENSIFHGFCGPIFSCQLILAVLIAFAHPKAAMADEGNTQKQEMEVTTPKTVNENGASAAIGGSKNQEQKKDSSVESWTTKYQGKEYRAETPAKLQVLINQDHKSPESPAEEIANDGKYRWVTADMRVQPNAVRSDDFCAAKYGEGYRTYFKSYYNRRTKKYEFERACMSKPMCNELTKSAEFLAQYNKIMTQGKNAIPSKFNALAKEANDLAKRIAKAAQKDVECPAGQKAVFLGDNLEADRYDTYRLLAPFDEQGEFAVREEPFCSDTYRCRVEVKNVAEYCKHPKAASLREKGESVEGSIEIDGFVCSVALDCPKPTQLVQLDELQKYISSLADDYVASGSEYSLGVCIACPDGMQYDPKESVANAVRFGWQKEPVPLCKGKVK